MNVLHNIGCLTTCSGQGQSGLNFICDAAVVWENDRILWIGPERKLPDAYSDAEKIDAGRGLVTPGLIDCHTHLAFGGWRADEFEMRVLGKSYLDIARAGGGIASTVAHTRAASEDALFEKAFVFLDEMMALGITTVECKSGYGLTLEDELKILRVYRRLNDAHPVRIVPTLLAAHIVPSEYKEDRAQYIRLITDEILPAVAKANLASFCDVFVEETAFSPEEAIEILNAAAAQGLRAKLHVDQLSDCGGGTLASDVNAISGDHLEYTSDEGIAAMAKKDVVAVSLPFATFNLRQPPMPARKFIDAGVPVAVATDFNPGSAPSYHLPAAMYMACMLQHMTPAEVLTGVTRIAAKAVGLESIVGQIMPGFKADFALIGAESVNQWISHLRPSANRLTVIEGKIVYQN